MSKHWILIHNPRAASGAAAQLRVEAEQLLTSAGISFEIRSSQQPGHAIDLTREAILEGHRNVVAFGGDGTVNEVANGILNCDLKDGDEVLMTQFPTGTGNDWRRTHDIPKHPKEWPVLLTNHKVQKQDVGRVEWLDGQVKKHRHFVNIAGIGFEAYAGQLANAQKAAGKGGIMSYVGALLKSLRQYHAANATLVLDGRRLESSLLFSAAIGICKYNGGGMKQCPNALVDDGLFDLTLIGEISKWDVIRNIPGLFSGKFVRHHAVSQHRASKIEIDCLNPILLEVDGENIGACPCSITLLPQRLNVAVPV